jgi:hypothetical protein
MPRPARANNNSPMVFEITGEGKLVLVADGEVVGMYQRNNSNRNSNRKENRDDDDDDGIPILQPGESFPPPVRLTGKKAAKKAALSKRA